MKKNLLVAQSGGPTAAINATVAGAIERALVSEDIDKIFGAVNGIKGVIEGRLIEIGETFRNPQNLQLLETTPAAALGSCRLKLKSLTENKAEYDAIIKTLKEFNIGYFIYIGGNDSMDTVLKLSEYCSQNGIDDIKIMGAPKTIDNDLCETDHTPGFGSAAKYIATTFAELKRDCDVYDIPAVTIVEVMGRNAGWLTASAALARKNGCGGPQLIYLPEVAFDLQNFIDDVKAELKKSPVLLIAVSEGIKNKDGNYAAESYLSGAVDAFGHKYLAGTSKFLADVVRERIGCKVRAVELNLMQRCASHIASQTDITESKMLGAVAVDRALSGQSGRMASIKRISDSPYSVSYDTVDIKMVANHEKVIPREWINAKGNDVTADMIRYLLPLIKGESRVIYKDGLPVHIKLH